MSRDSRQELDDLFTPLNLAVDTKSLAESSPRISPRGGYDHHDLDSLCGDAPEPQPSPPLTSAQPASSFVSLHHHQQQQQLAQALALQAAVLQQMPTLLQHLTPEQRQALPPDPVQQMQLIYAAILAQHHQQFAAGLAPLPLAALPPGALQAQTAPVPTGPFAGPAATAPVAAASSSYATEARTTVPHVPMNAPSTAAPSPQAPVAAAAASVGTPSMNVPVPLQQSQPPSARRQPQQQPPPQQPASGRRAIAKAGRGGLSKAKAPSKGKEEKKGGKSQSPPQRGAGAEPDRANQCWGEHLDENPANHTNRTKNRVCKDCNDAPLVTKGQRCLWMHDAAKLDYLRSCMNAGQPKNAFYKAYTFPGLGTVTAHEFNYEDTWNFEEIEAAALHKQYRTEHLAVIMCETEAEAQLAQKALGLQEPPTAESFQSCSWHKRFHHSRAFDTGKKTCVKKKTVHKLSPSPVSHYRALGATPSTSASAAASDYTPASSAASATALSPSNSPGQSPQSPGVAMDETASTGGASPFTDASGLSQPNSPMGPSPYSSPLSPVHEMKEEEAEYEYKGAGIVMPPLQPQPQPQWGVPEAVLAPPYPLPVLVRDRHSPAVRFVPPPGLLLVAQHLTVYVQGKKGATFYLEHNAMAGRQACDEFSGFRITEEGVLVTLPRLLPTGKRAGTPLDRCIVSLTYGAHSVQVAVVFQSAPGTDPCESSPRYFNHSTSSSSSGDEDSRTDAPMSRLYPAATGAGGRGTKRQNEEPDTRPTKRGRQRPIGPVANTTTAPVPHLAVPLPQHRRAPSTSSDLASASRRREQPLLPHLPRLHLPLPLPPNGAALSITGDTGRAAPLASPGVDRVSSEEATARHSVDAEGQWSRARLAALFLQFLAVVLLGVSAQVFADASWRVALFVMAGMGLVAVAPCLVFWPFKRPSATYYYELRALLAFAVAGSVVQHQWRTHTAGGSFTVPELVVGVFLLLSGTLACTARGALRSFRHALLTAAASLGLTAAALLFGGVSSAASAPLSAAGFIAVLAPVVAFSWALLDATALATTGTVSVLRAGSGNAIANANGAVSLSPAREAPRSPPAAQNYVIEISDSAATARPLHQFVYERPTVDRVIATASFAASAAVFAVPFLAY